MAKILGKYKDDYKDVVSDDKNETGMSKIYSAYNKKTKLDCCLKVISKEKLKIQDYNYLLERLKKEQEIQTLCNSKNTVNFYKRLETEENIIFELEYCDDNLNNYLQENGELSREKKFFKEIVVSIAKALKTLNEKGIMHRDIKPQNIFIKNSSDENNRIIKLGDFGCAIRISENDNDSIGTVLYNAPEIVQDLEYDEKVDLWSLGVTLFELYFGVLPYGYDANIKLNIHYYNCLKRALFKPSAFFKGIILPMSKTLSGKEASIIGSILRKCSIPNNHASAALVKLMEICKNDKIVISVGALFFMRLLLVKKYAFPKEVKEKMVNFFLGYYDFDKDKLPVLWHQCLLCFVQHYKLYLTDMEKNKLKELNNRVAHHLISSEINKELSFANSRQQDDKNKNKEKMQIE